MAAGTIFILLGILVIISGGMFLADFGEMWGIGWWHDAFVRTEWFKTAPAVMACGLILLSLGILTVMIAKRFRRMMAKLSETKSAVEQKSNVGVQIRPEPAVVTVPVERIKEDETSVPFSTSESVAEETFRAASVPDVTQQDDEPIAFVSTESEELVDDEGDEENDWEGEEEARSYNMSFKAQLIEDAAEGGRLQEYYTELKNELMSYHNVRGRMAWESESFQNGRVQLVRWLIRGKSLRMYFAMIPHTIDAKYRTSDASDSKKFARTPVLLKVNSARSLAHAKELIAQMMELYGIPRRAAKAADYRFPPLTTEEMLERGWIKHTGD